jgi:signal peptidase I
LAGTLALLRVFFCLSMVTGASMLPTLRPGDLLVVNKSAYRKVPPRRGDLVAIRGNRELLIKRIVGLPGEEVEVIGGRLYVNGFLIPEHYGTNDGSLDIGKGRLLVGRFAALGDNRAVAPEVVVVSIVSKADIVGKVVVSVRP